MSPNVVRDDVPGQMIGDATLADAILDRLVHNAHKIKMRGESMRKRKAGTKESLTETDQ